MSLRITQNILYSLSLRDLNRSSLGQLALQEQIASGRRVNRPSDDPAGALRILPLHAELRDLDLTLDNVGIARETLTVSSGALQEGSTLMSRARELAVQGANATYGGPERERMADEIDQILQQLVALANTKRGSRYLFAGTRNDSPAFGLETDSGGTRVRYLGDSGEISIQAAPGIESSISEPGNSIFQVRNRGATTILDGTTGVAPSGATDSGVGLENLRVTFAGLSGAPSTISAGTGTTTALGPLTWSFGTAPTTLSIGGGPAIAIPVTNGTFTTSDGRTMSLTVSGVPASTSGTMTAQADLSTDGGATSTRVDFTSSTVQVENSFAKTVLNLDVSALRKTGTDLVKYGGTFDVFSALIAVRDTMRNGLGATDAKVSERITQLIGDLDGAHDDLLAGLQSLGHRGESMQLLQNRVAGLKDATRETLSGVEDTDLADTIVSYQQKQLSYQSALQVTGKILSVSLLNFLR